MTPEVILPWIAVGLGCATIAAVIVIIACFIKDLFLNKGY